jgi:AIG2 family protein
MTLHFAYGSNMSRALMVPRCPTAREIGVAILDGFRFIVTADGYASVVRAPGERVHGLAWRLAPRDLAALNAYEGLDHGLYRAATLPVRIGTACMPALVYVGRSRVPGVPRPGYLDCVLAAARELELPTAYVDALARWTAPRLKPARGEAA